jgi:hypothetical protein
LCIRSVDTSYVFLGVFVRVLSVFSMDLMSGFYRFSSTNADTAKDPFYSRWSDLARWSAVIDVRSLERHASRYS